MAVKPPASPTPGKVTITHPEKILFPALGLTKGDVAGYYRRIARRLLPYLHDRPVTLERLPEGAGIVIDDLGAGLYALAGMQLLLHYRWLAP